MDAALLKTVEANRKALQQFVDQGVGLQEKQMKGVLANLEKMEDMFFATVSKAAQGAGQPLQGPWEQVLEAMKLKGTGTGARREPDGRAADGQAQTALRDGRASGLKAAQAMMDSYTTLVSGVLIGMSEGCSHRRRHRQVAPRPASARLTARRTARMDALILARMQFAANITFHILFPTISIALGWLLLFFRWRWLRTRNGPDRAHAQGWLDAYRFWTKVFALTFALGVVSGITMSFQFGTNWPGFMETVGNVAGPLLGYEVLTAFFLEAGFLGVMLFGHGRVSERVHLHVDLLRRLRHHAVGVLDPGAELVDADAHRPRDRRRRVPRQELGRGDLQPLVPVPLHAHAAGLGADLRLPAGRAVGLAAAARRGPALGAAGAARRPDAGGAC